ncbi:unnamed protein product [Ophioblennius macclurei]
MQAGDGRERSSRSTSSTSSSSFSLLSPDAWTLRGKKRKQASRDADSLSLCSLDINVAPPLPALFLSLCQHPPPNQDAPPPQSRRRGSLFLRRRCRRGTPDE